MFMNEFDILDRRLEYLKDSVDCFVLVESSVSHGGNTKECLFDKQKEKYKDYNIIHVISNKLPEEFIGYAKKYNYDSLNWDREMYQRHMVLEGLERGGAKPDDVIIISDVDEIPNKDYVRDYGPGRVIGLHMTHFQFSLKHLQTDEPWVGSVICRCDLFKEKEPNFFRYNRWRFMIFKQAGWHLSSFGDLDTIVYKYKNYAHCEDPGMEEKDYAYFEKIVREGYKVSGKTKMTETPKEILETLPKELNIQLF